MVRKYSYAEAERREAGVRAGMASGRFVYQQYSARIRCTYCGRSGWASGSWLDNCLLGHPYVCACGRVFASKQAIATHRRHRGCLVRANRVN
jgi:hypothetical protein